MSNAAKLSAGIFASLGTLLIIIGLILAMNTQPATADDMLSLGKRYLLELQFEQALVQFLGVIEIEPMNARAYLGAAEAFIGLGQVDEAIDILRIGLERTGNELIQQRLAELELPSSDRAVDWSDMDDEWQQRIEHFDEIAEEGLAAALIRIIDVQPRNFTPGVPTTFSVTVRYESANTGGLIIYAGAETTEQRGVFRLYDQFLLPDQYGTHTFQFTVVPVDWPGGEFGIYVNISELSISSKKGHSFTEKGPAFYKKRSNILRKRTT